MAIGDDLRQEDGVIRALRARADRWLGAIGRLRRLVGWAGFPFVVGGVAAVLTGVFRDHATPESLNAGLASLITVNAVVVGLTYATTHKAVLLATRTDEGSGFALRVFFMVLGSMLGILFAVVHLVWSPDSLSLLPVAAGLLVGAPALLPMLAVHEFEVRRAETVEAIEGVLAEQRREDDHGGLGESGSDGSGLVRLRPRTFVAEPSHPFANDVLGREPQVKAFCSVLTGIETPVVLSVDGGWGAGKTAFVKMCAAWMRTDASASRGVSVVEFNAWTQSHTGDPLRDMVAAVTDQITEGDTERRRKIAELLRRQAAKLASDGLLDDAFFSLAEGPERELATFKDALRGDVSDCGGRLVAFVDELDRCRPDYALGILEKVRHLFDVDGVVVVLAVNREALDHAVGALHGPPGKAERYLRRFVDQATRLPDPDEKAVTAFMEHLYRETGLTERMKVETYTRLILELLTGLADGSLRDLEQAVHRVLVVFASVPRSSDDAFDMSDAMWAWEQAAMTLMVLREVDRDAYRKFTSKQINAFEAGEALRAASIEIGPVVRTRMEVLLLLGKYKGEEPMLNAEFWEQYVDAGRADDGTELQKLYGQFLGRLLGKEHDIAYLAGLIELTHYDPMAQDHSHVN